MHEKVCHPNQESPSRVSDGVSSGEGWGGDHRYYRPWTGVDIMGGLMSMPCSFLCYVPRDRAADYQRAGWKIVGIADDQGYSFIGQWEGRGEPLIPAPAAHDKD